MSDTRPTGTTHDPDAVERVAAKLADHDTDANWYWDDDGGETFLTWDTMPDEDWTDRGMNVWTKGRDYYREMAGVALSAIEELYVDEGGARP